MTNKVHSNTVTVDLKHESQVCSAQVDVVYKHGRLYGQGVHLSGYERA